MSDAKDKIETINKEWGELMDTMGEMAALEVACEAKGTTMQELKEGDWVRDILTDKIGQVERKHSSNYPLEVYFAGNSYCSMTKDGRHRIDDKNPRFIKCNPPKKKVKKKIYTYVLEDKYSKGVTSLCVFPNSNTFNYYNIVAEFVNEFEIEE